jgi:uncharacterized protein YgiM (DUF1202 family)
MTVVNRELSTSSTSSAGEILMLDKGAGVVITSSPQGADVTVDGKSYGQTPLSLPEITPGEHNFTLSHPNWLKRDIRATIPPEMVLNLEIDLAISEADLGNISAPKVTTLPKLVVGQTPTGFLRVRDKPSLAGEEIGKVYPGQNLTALEEARDGWYKVKLENGVEGYVSASYVQKQP